MRRRGKVAAIAAAGVVAGSVVATGSTVGTQAGCTLQGTCDQSTVYVPSFPSGTTGAQYITAQAFEPEAGVYEVGGNIAWLSSPINGTWMDFPGQRSYVVYPTWPDGGPFLGPYELSAYVSADQNPGTISNANWATGTGNVAEFSNLPDGGDTGFIVTNDTCTEYFLQILATQELPFAPPSADTADAAGSQPGDAATGG